MIIQQKKQEEMIENFDTNHKYSNSKELLKLSQILQNLEKTSDLSPFIYYLLGVTYKELNMLDNSKAALIECLNNCPFLWSAWVELSLLCKQSDIVKKLFYYLENNIY